MERHLQQWRHNREFLAEISPRYPDWAVSVTFYAALHLVDVLLVHDRVQGIVSHETRNRTLQRTNRYAKIWSCYKPLHDLSRTVRYLADPIRWVPWDKVKSEVLPRYLFPIEHSVSRLCSIELGVQPVDLRTQ